ncbi:MAG: hypothetical protein JRJ25_01850 [Deltaproteobacteria bacterium]|nr:hypothetical protein [Deltaproteobacteria bacterium]
MEEMISTNRELLEDVINILRDLSNGKSREQIELKITNLEEIVDHLPSELEVLGELLSRDKFFNAALRKIDTTLIRKASELAKDSFPYVHGRKLATEDNNYEKQLELSMYALFHELDASGLTSAILKHDKEFFLDFRYSNADFLRKEYKLIKDFGLDISQYELEKLSKRADKNKRSVLAKLSKKDPETGAKIVDPSTQLAPFISGIGGLRDVP